MNKIFSLLILGLLCTVSLSAENKYVGFSLGTNNPKRSDSDIKGQKIGYRGDFKIGYRLANGISTEFETGYRENDCKKRYYTVEMDNTNAKQQSKGYSWSYMINALYDLNSMSYESITPYFGIGIGYCVYTDKSKTQYDTFTVRSHKKDDRFAYQGIIGVKYPINDLTSIGVQYNLFVGRNHQKDHGASITLARGF